LLQRVTVDKKAI